MIDPSALLPRSSLAMRLCGAAFFSLLTLLLFSSLLNYVYGSGWSLMSTTRKKASNDKQKIETTEGVATNRNFRGNGDKSAANIAGNSNNKAASEGDGIDSAKDNDQIPVNRTATGGLVNNILNFLVIFSFAGNLGFMIYSTFPSLGKKR